MKKKSEIYLFLLAALLFAYCNTSTETNGIDSEKENLYNLVWSDEFNYNGLPDTVKWSYDTEGNSHGWGNNELQHYTANRKENASVDDEYLYIKAVKEAWKGKDYTSARLISKNKGDWLYGRFEVRAKLPSGRGTWPAIWMLPTDWEYGDWPKSGEIDIMEHVGYEPDSIYASAHTESYHHSIGTNKTAGIEIKDSESAFHDYILEWEKDEYKVYVDTNLYLTFKNEGSSYKEWPFDKRFHILLNVAVGGNWGAVKGIDTNIFPQEMVIDYVRVYQKK